MRKKPIVSVTYENNERISIKKQLTVGGVYVRKLAPARVSYQDDVLISYRVKMMMGHFISQRLEGTLHVDKIHL